MSGLSRFRHCPLDEVEWPFEQGDECWFCGKEGLSGNLPARLHASDDYYRYRDVPPKPREATA